jgi:hypothetical protein
LNTGVSIGEVEASLLRLAAARSWEELLWASDMVVIGGQVVLMKITSSNLIAFILGLISFLGNDGLCNSSKFSKLLETSTVRHSA